MSLGISYRPAAVADLQDLFWYIDSFAPALAETVIQSVRASCLNLCRFPYLGRARSDLAAGLRVLPLKRRLVIAYIVGPDSIEVIRILRHGRDYEAILSEPEG